MTTAKALPLVALVVFVALALPPLSISPAVADGGAGSAGSGGSGGMDNPTGPGGAGGNGNGPGGGGAGTTGGSPGSDGFSTGGAGGSHGVVQPTLPGAAASGTAGGNASFGFGGGGGGAGGFGAVVTGTGALGTLNVSAIGGNGGSGGNGNGFVFGGNGGSGGTGLYFTSGGVSVTIQAAVTGGTGGQGGILAQGQGLNGLAGPGGAGIVGQNLNLTVESGANISGGYSGDGTTLANAITFTGGNNTLTLNGGQITGNIDVTGTLNINTMNAWVEVTAGITGSGDISIVGSGTITTTGVNSYTGNTAIGSGILVFNSPSDWTYGGIISGSSSSFLSLVGTGTLTLTGVSPFQGTVSVGGSPAQGDGSLIVNGSLTDVTAVEVNTSNSVLGGTGTVGPVLMTAGTLAPGNPGNSPIGTLSTHGVTFFAGSIYSVDVSAAAADRVNGVDPFGGTVLNGGTVRATYAPGNYVPTRYIILTDAGGLSGTFTDLVNVNLPTNLKASLSYDSNSVYLSLALDYSATVASGGTNHRNVAGGLTNSYNTTGGIPAAFVSLNSHGLAQVAGSTSPASHVSSLHAAGAFMSNVMKYAGGAGASNLGQSGSSPSAGIMSYAGDDSAYSSEGLAYSGGANARRSPAEREAYAMVRKAARLADPAPRWSVWAEGYGGMERTEGNPSAGTATTTSRIYGLSSGFVYHRSADTQFGFALGGGRMSFGLAEGLGGGSSDLVQTGVSARHSVGARYVAGMLGYGWQRMTTERNVLGTDQLRARFDVNSISGRLEAGHRIETAVIGVTPYAAGQFTTLFMPAYAEQTVTGANGFALAYAADRITVPRSELGIRTEKSFALENATATLFGRAAWAHNFNADRRADAVFQSLPGSAFTVNGAASAPNAALVSAGVETTFRNGWTLAASFDGEFSSVTQSYAGRGAVRYRW